MSATELPIDVPRITRLGCALCLTGASLGAVGIFAWLFRMERVLTTGASLPPMMPNSAFALLLLGCTGAIVLRGHFRLSERWLVRSAALAVLVISLGTIVEYALGSQLFLDQLVRGRMGSYYPSPSSPSSAVAFTLLAAGVLFFDSCSGKRFRPSEWLILSTALIAITALLGYLYGASSAYRLTGPPPVGLTPTSMKVIRFAGEILLVGVSFSTAVSLLLISAGLFLGRPDWVTMRIVTGPGPGGMLVRRLVPIAILVPIGFGIIASRLPGTGDNPVVLAAMTDATSILSLAFLGITAHRINHGHEALEHARRQAHELIELASDGIVIADLDGRLTDVNEVGCRLHGYSREEILTKSIVDLIPPEDEQRLWSHRKLLLEGNADVEEWIAVRKDASRFPVEVSAKILPDGRWEAIVRDISERKRHEEALRLSEAAARRATRARDDVLAIVAHDLRNPLTTILTLSAILRKTDSQREVGEEIARAADRMSHLIRDLVDATRLEAGTLEIRQERLPTHEVLREVLDSQALLATSASLTLWLDAPSSLPDLWADHHRLLQVFENLVGNAIKFTKPDGRITLGASAGTGEVLFWVADTGCGITSDELPHVFERFWQAPEAKRQGVGLGLPIVEGVVQAHGGRVWVESSPGRGTTFFFTIPIATQTVNAQCLNSLKSSSQGTTTPAVQESSAKPALPGTGSPASRNRSATG